MRYLRVYTITLLLILSLVASFNWLIDPYAMFWSPVYEGLNSKKTEAGDRVRITKPYRIEQLRPETALIGNSRIEMGIVAESRLHPYAKVYNLGIPGISLERQLISAAKQLHSNPNLKSLIISVDYLDFLYPTGKLIENEHNAELLVKTDAKNDRVKDKIGLLISLDTFISSLKTLFKQQSVTSHITRFGTNRADSYITIMRREGIKPLFRQKFDELKSRMEQSELRLRLQNSSYNPGLQLLDQLIELSLDKKIKINIFVSPYHYSYLHVLSEFGHWDSFQQWKKSLATLGNKDSKLLQLWDFSGFNHITLESVNLDTPHEQMSWYWEPAHYKSELGEKILEAMIKQVSFDGFARLLTSENIKKITEQDNLGLHDSTKQWKALKKGLKANF